MLGDDLQITDGASAGAWIEPRLGGEFGAVTHHVPKGYEAYARVFHPASDSGGNPVRWAEVAERLSSAAHREMQWYALVGCSDPDDFSDSKWVGLDPLLGEMDPPTLDALCKILAAHTSDVANCLLGLCVIEGWEESFTADELRQPFLKLPHGGDHIVLTGPLAAVDQIVYDASELGVSLGFVVAHAGDGPPPEPDPSDFIWRTSPNLIWPADWAWFVASEVDFYSTLVGGSAELIKAIVESSDLEAWQMEPTDSLAYDADKINSDG